MSSLSASKSISLRRRCLYCDLVAAGLAKATEHSTA